MKTKDEAIRRLLVKMPAASDRRIAGIIVALLRCDVKDVSRIRRDMLAAAELLRQDIDEDRIDDI